MPLNPAGVPSRAAIQAAIDEAVDRALAPAGVTYASGVATVFGGSKAYRRGGIGMIQINIQLTSNIAAGAALFTVPAAFAAAEGWGGMLARFGGAEAAGVFISGNTVATAAAMSNGQIWSGALTYPTAT